MQSDRKLDSDLRPVTDVIESANLEQTSGSHMTRLARDIHLAESRGLNANDSASQTEEYDPFQREPARVAALGSKPESPIPASSTTPQAAAKTEIQTSKENAPGVSGGKFFKSFIGGLGMDLISFCYNHPIKAAASIAACVAIPAAVVAVGVPAATVATGLLCVGGITGVIEVLKGLQTLTKYSAGEATAADVEESGRAFGSGILSVVPFIGRLRNSRILNNLAAKVNPNIMSESEIVTNMQHSVKLLSGMQTKCEQAINIAQHNAKTLEEAQHAYKLTWVYAKRADALKKEIDLQVKALPSRQIKEQASIAEQYHYNIKDLMQGTKEAVQKRAKIEKKQAASNPGTAPAPHRRLSEVEDEGVKRLVDDAADAASDPANELDIPLFDDPFENAIINIAKKKSINLNLEELKKVVEAVGNKELDVPYEVAIHAALDNVLLWRKRVIAVDEMLKSQMKTLEEIIEPKIKHEWEIDL